MNSRLTSSNKLFVLVAAAALFVTSIGAAQAQVLLDVQISSSGTVTITTTGNASSENITGALDDGVDLIGFFQGNTGGANVGAATTGLTSTGNSGSDVFVQAYGDSLEEVTNVDLNLYNAGSHASEVFNTTQAAFTGTMTFALGAYDLPTVGDSGAIYTGYRGSSTTNEQIGTWQVVGAPEPSSWMLLLGSLVLFAIHRVRRKLGEQARVRIQS